MQYTCALALVVTAVTAISIPQPRQAALIDQAALRQDKFLIELAPEETRWVTEDEKWNLRRVPFLGRMPHIIADVAAPGRPQFHGHNF